MDTDMAILPTAHFPGEPMLSATAPAFDKLSYPVCATGKVDGVRCLIRLGNAFTRQLKPFPNPHFNSMVAAHVADQPLRLDGVEMELITDTDGVINPGATDHLASRTSGVLMRHSGEPMIHGYVFDIQPTPENGIPIDMPYRERFAYLRRMEAAGLFPDWVECVQYAIARTPEQLTLIEARYAAMKLEGMVLRRPDLPYKFGRATANEGGFSRVVGWTSCEARIVGAVEAVENTNEKVTLASGKKERQTSVAGRKPLGRLGAWQMETLTTPPIRFGCGTGFSHEEGKEFWENRADYVGKIARIRSKSGGVKTAPRQPVWDGIRDPSDM
jgi:DNA ligase-1